MARGSDTATGAAKLGSNTASSAYGTVLPELAADSMHPPGFSEKDMAAMDTAGQQSAGGSTAGAVGQGALLAGRTKNPGTSSAAIAQSARNAGEEQSKGALGVRMANAKLKEDQKQGARQGLQNVAATSIGAVAPNVNANTNAASQSWDWARNILQPVLSAAGGPVTGKFLG